eukprot:gnl/MRDRNA2_/MRDRNA2_170566_c0_seq1.p1 gnl/MRDRNA2_/MRDRNA2_170566_c0~~gnl/MRDRNA2_/MRDRNA2_170566_c0_seq1.p1  ORF type:complete len:183 (-),score=32.85 gnl/MRDRNA2_/MRDRNA2_170566_c0_seq1:201-749(-)
MADSSDKVVVHSPSVPSEWDFPHDVTPSFTTQLMKPHHDGSKVVQEDGIPFEWDFPHDAAPSFMPQLSLKEQNRMQKLIGKDGCTLSEALNKIVNARNSESVLQITPLTEDDVLQHDFPGCVEAPDALRMRLDVMEAEMDSLKTALSKLKRSPRPAETNCEPLKLSVDGCRNIAAALQQTKS